MSFLPLEMQRSQNQQRITEALAVAYRNGLAIPDSISRADELRRAVDAAAEKADPLPVAVLPDKPSGVAGVIAKTAAERSQREHAVKVAGELRALAQERYVAEIRQVVAGWVAPLVQEFDARLTTFREAVVSAPYVNADQLSGLSASSFTAWQNAQAAAFALEALVEDRRVLATALGENFTSNIFGDFISLVAVVTPPKAEMTDALSREARERVPVLQEIGKGIPQAYMTAGAGTPPLQGVARWRALLDAEARGWLRLGLAGTGVCEPRLRLTETWAQVVPHMTADSQNQGGSLTSDLLDRAAIAHRTLTPPTPVAV